MALGFMRRHKRWLYVFLWVVVAAFVIAYIPAFTGMGIDSRAAGATLVEVGSMPITVGEYQKAYMRQREMYLSLYQGRLDSEALKRMGLEEQTLQGLIDDRVLQLEAQRLGITVDDETILQRLATSPEFQVDGRFMGKDEIRRRLEMQGVTVAEFEQELRRRILRERLASLVTDGVMVSAKEAEEEFRRRTEQVKAEYVMVPAEVSSVVVSEADVRARFDASKDRYAFPERRVLSYLLLDLPKLQPRVTVTEAEERAYYDAHPDEFKQAEQVCASHILVKVKATPEATEGHPEEEARKLAQSALDQVRKGADFATLAKKMSEDEGSAPQGGSLRCFPRGQMVPEFDNAAFALQAGETSELVKTQYGYHVIHATAHRPESTLAFAQAKDRIHQTLMGQRVRTLLEEQLQGISEALRHGKSIDDVAKERGFTVDRSLPLARSGDTQPLSSPPLLARAFELKRGETEPEPFQVPTGYVFISVQEIQAPRPAEFKEVQDRVKADLQQEKAFETARAKAADLKTRAAAASLEKAAAGLALVRKETPGLVSRGQPMGDLGTSVGLDEAAYALEPNVLSDPIRVPGGWAVVRVTEKKAFDPAAFEKDKASLITSLRSQRREELFRSYMQEARKRVTVQRNVEAFRRVMAS
ncbi:MAG TPA: peptidyl-prolyl cis-trans isomerase [Vicinamibacteria bacterium]|nr:peptidyl-prolyl cis-trans isomerase [Vicinamibacteria bacterium]